MNTPRLLRIANRINLLLLREIGEGIDCKRMLVDALYARDVLLVCDASPGSDLASLAQHFRDAQAEPADEAGQGSGFGADSSGFGTSRLPLVAADAAEAARLLPAVEATAPRWYSPSRWLGR